MHFKTKKKNKKIVTLPIISDGPVQVFSAWVTFVAKHPKDFI